MWFLDCSGQVAQELAADPELAIQLRRLSRAAPGEEKLLAAFNCPPGGR
jgi:hypothetical protein